MKRFAHVLLVLVVVFLFSCSGSSSGGGDDGGNDGGDAGGGASEAAVGASGVNGVITDLSGTTLSDVTVTMVGGDTTTSGVDGTFSIESDAGTDKILVISKTGYVTSSKAVDVYSGAVSNVAITMIAEETAKTLDADIGGEITGTRNASINAPAGVFVKKDGSSVTGQVQVSLTPIDPAILAESLAYPGDMRGLTKDGDIVLLETFGVMDVTVRQNGAELQIKDGQTIEVEIPAPSSGATPDSTPMWIFNIETGLWEESLHGEGTFNAADNTYIADIGHLSPLNCDKPIVPTCITGNVVDAEGNPVGGAFVQAIPDVGGISSDYTDLNGYFCMYVERDRDMTLKVQTPITESCPAEMQEDGFCVTTRDFRSSNNAASQEYPADCSNDCQRIIPVIRTGDVDPGPMDEATCVVVSGVDSPFSGTCASGLSQLYDCFSPEGACEYENDPLSMLGPSFEMTYENGARMESEFSALGYKVKFYGPTGELCGWTSYLATGGTTMTTASGNEYKIITTEAGGLEIECDGGLTFALNADQMDALAGCSASVEDDGTGVVCEAKAGTFGAICSFDSDCDGSAGMACCGPIGEEKNCYYENMCATMCFDDVDCDGTFICCSLGYYSICMSAEQCP